MFDSPFEYCAVCGEYVLLDQTCEECAREHRCGTSCPLQAFFTGVEFVGRARAKRGHGFDRSQCDSPGRA